MGFDYIAGITGLSLLITGVFLLMTKNQRFTLKNRERMIKNKAACILDSFKRTEYWKSKKMEQTDREIYESISFMRNIAALGNGRQISSDHMISQLAEREGNLKPAYMKMLALLRVNKKIKAIEAFADETGTVMGREFAGLLLQWDELDPTSLSEILLSHQKNIKESRITARKKKDETISDLIFLPVVINVMVIFVNFIYTTYYLEQQEMFKMFF